METARLDLDNLHGNTCDGIHAANMAGTWMSVAYGFAGMRAYEGKLSFKPYLPIAWQAYRLSINFKKRLLKVAVSEQQVEFLLVEGESLLVKCFDREVLLSQGEPSIVQFDCIVAEEL